MGLTDSKRARLFFLLMRFFFPGRHVGWEASKIGGRKSYVISLVGNAKKRGFGVCVFF